MARAGGCGIGDEVRWVLSSRPWRHGLTWLGSPMPATLLDIRFGVAMARMIDDRRGGKGRARRGGAGGLWCNRVLLQAEAGEETIFMDGGEELQLGSKRELRAELE
ncbi:hypothetical protein M0R45_008880 [Rubus argutus]|uniref:Uncharacterized protein n=1 Tax=Rubus argutus TaxID=59490 RepID=A0AAW1Y3D9_RUBAR